MKKLKLSGLILFSMLCISQIVSSQKALTLQQALELAYKSSPRIEKEQLSLVRSEENLKAKRASLKSNFSLNINPFSYSNNSQFNSQFSRWYNVEDYNSSSSLNVSQPILATDGTISLINNFSYRENNSTSAGRATGFDGFSNTLKLRLEQPLFTYNRTKLELKELEYAYENASLNYALQMLSVENMVTQAFYKVYKTQISLNIAQEEYQNRDESHQIIKNKVEGGLVAREELYQSELDLLSSKSKVQNAEVSLQNDMDNFKQMLGIDLDEEIIALADISINPIDVDLNKAIANGISKRMEIRQREIAIEEGQFDLIKTNAQNEFKGQISVDYGLFGENKEVSKVFENMTDNQGVSIGFSIPLFDWGEKKARLRAAQASLQINKNNLRDEEIDIKLNIRKVYRSLENQLIQIEISGKNVENAKLTYEINLEKYRNGDLTSMDLNLIQNQLTQNKNKLTNAIIDYKLELLNMKIQSMYDFENQQAVVPNFSPKNN